MDDFFDTALLIGVLTTAIAIVIKALELAYGT
jgi:hypothetical protein